MPRICSDFVKKYRVATSLKAYTGVERIPEETLRKIYIGSRNRRTLAKFSINGASVGKLITNRILM